MTEPVQLAVVNEQQVAEVAQMLCDALDGPGRVLVPHDVGLAALADAVSTSIQCMVDEADRTKRLAIYDALLDYVYRRAYGDLHARFVRRMPQPSNVVPLKGKDADEGPAK